ncbi:MAG: efflux RND transporter periplasmic adaptor subunit [Acetobacteraceae bacterium]
MMRVLRLVCSLVAVCLLLAVNQAEATTRPDVVVDVTTCLVKPKQVVQLGSPVFGLIAGVFVDRGDVVQQGQLLAKLDTTVEEAQVALDRFRATNTTAIDAARIDMAWQQRELARRQQLVGNMFSRANEVDEIVTKIEQDRIALRKGEADQKTAMLEAERSEVQLKLKLIRSPLNGVVTDMRLMPGEFIHEQATIMTIAQIDPLNIDLVVPAERYGAVRVGTVADLQLASPINMTLPAKVDAVDPVIDPASDTFRIRLVLPNPGNAIPAGVRCSVRLPDAGETDE